MYRPSSLHFRIEPQRSDVRRMLVYRKGVRLVLVAVAMDRWREPLASHVGDTLAQWDGLPTPASRLWCRSGIVVAGGCHRSRVWGVGRIAPAGAGRARAHGM